MLPARFSEDFSSRWAHVVYVVGPPSYDRKRCCMNPASSSFTLGYLFFYQLWGNVGGTYANDPLVSQPISKPQSLSHTAHEPQGRVQHRLGDEAHVGKHAVYKTSAPRRPRTDVNRARSVLRRATIQKKRAYHLIRVSKTEYPNPHAYMRSPNDSQKQRERTTRSSTTPSTPYRHATRREYE